MKKLKFSKLLLLVYICVFFSGCLVGPNYRPPEVFLPDHWNVNESFLCISPYEDPPIAWWQVFNDSLLNKYIEMAALCNKDILTAEANIWQARAFRQIAASDLFPHISADLNATRTYFSKNGPVFAFTPGGQDPNSATSGLPFQIQIPQTQNIFNALIDASWEIDLFGKRRRSVEAADANVDSTVEQRNSVLISVFAEVAINYMELRSNQKRGLLIEEYISLLEENLLLSTKRFEVGYSDRLDLERSEAELAQSIAQLPILYAQIHQNIYALSILTGNLPETLMEELCPLHPIPSPPSAIAIGIRSDLLRRRPDVRYAERQLAVATANIGVAVASFFPSFTLIGDIGFQSLSLSNLFQAKSLTWALEGNVRIPIFQGGKLVGNLRANEAAAAAAAFTYQKTVLQAIKEAESGLAFYFEDLQTSEQLKEVASKYASLVFLTSERYAKGLISLTDVLDSQRHWNTAQQNLLTSETSALIDLIILYKALGGGWEPAAESECKYAQ